MNSNFRNFFHRATLAFGVAAVFGFGGSLDLNAAPLNLSKVPLYTNESVDPNFVLSTDDSGSMRRAYVPDQLNKASALLPPLYTTPINTLCFWQDRNFVFSSTGNPIYFNPDIVYEPAKKADGTSFGDASFTVAWNDGIDDRSAANSRNLGTEFRLDWDIGNSPDVPRYIEHSDTPANCVESIASAVTVRRKLPFEKHAFYYEYTGPALPPEVGPINELPADAATRLLSRQTLIFTDANYTARKVSDAQKANFANWYSYYRTRNHLTRTALTRVFDSQQNLRMVWQDINSPALSNSNPIKSITSATTDGATHRAALFKHIFDLEPTGGTPNRLALKRVGDYFSTANTSASNSESNPYYDRATNQILSCRQNFHLLVTDGAWKDAAGRNDATDTAAMTLPPAATTSPATVGRAYPGSAADKLHNRIYWTETSSTGNPGLADNAFYYWATDLRPDLKNNVPASYNDLTVGVSDPGAAPLGADENPRDRPEIYWNPSNDPATWQHLVQYIVAFGVDGTLPNPEALIGFRKNPIQNNPATGAPWSWPAWPLEGGESPQKVDDTWHATINSRGDFFSARSPQDLIDSLNAVFLSVGKRTSSNTPVSLSSGLLTSATLGYQTLFDTSDWSGRLLATRLATSPPTPEWDVSCILTGGACPSVPSAGTLAAVNPNTRIIATRRPGATTGVPFRYASLSGAQQTLLNKNPDTNVADTLGSDRVNYIRGDRTKETQNGGSFRPRKNLLGAIVNSAALVPQDKEDYIDDVSFELSSLERGSPYSVFASTVADYNTIFVGANDGMLHAINSGAAADGGGSERWAYVPTEVVKNLNKLTSKTALNFQSYVDATPQVRDVYVNGSWRRILVGGLRLGGQGIYALDVTNPVATSEGDLAAKVMWEFSGTTAAGVNLGYTYGNPYLTRLANGDWVALVPSGYNPEEADGNAGNGNAHLFVLRLSDGAVIKDFDLGGTSKGLSSVVAGDYRAVGDNPVPSVSDVAFAGDINGNIWRFNLEGATPATWTSVKFFTAPANQSITVQPRLVRTAYADVGTVRRKYVVTFGTGKYIEGLDRATTYQQAYYGLYDQGATSSEYPLTYAKLQRQTLSTAGAVRRLTTDQIGATKFGWYFNFIASGERNIAQAVVRNVSGTLIFTTLAPLSTDPCEPAAESYLMFVDATTGGVPGTAAAGVDSDNDGVPDQTDIGQLSPSFDSNRDGRVNGSDDALAVGLQLNGYIAGVTPIASVGGGSAKIIIPDDDCVGPSCPSDSVEIANYEWRRRSWRELFDE